MTYFVCHLQEVNIEFEAYSISDNDYDGIKKLLQQVWSFIPCTWVCSSKKFQAIRYKFCQNSVLLVQNSRSCLPSLPGGKNAFSIFQGLPPPSLCSQTPSFDEHI